MAAYLFVHFIGEQKDGEQIYFSVSRDGLHWKDLHYGNPVLRSKIGEEGARDPFLVKDPEKEKYYLLATDLRIEAGKGWQAAQFEGSRDLLVWESEDLLTWSEARSVTVGVEGAGCVWAPEAVYDEQKKSFFVFWASMVDGKQKIYSSYTKDFKEFSAPQIYIERENHIIDTTIIRAQGVYYRFSKDETTKRIHLESSNELEGEYTGISSPVLDGLEGVEGPECYELPDGRYCLIVDRFAEGKGYLPLVTGDLSSGEFRILSDEEYDFDKYKKRHGGVAEISDQEYYHLAHQFADKNPVIKGLYADPDIAAFDGKYYIYPTTDGYEGWSGTKFYVFSSPTGKEFQNRGQILDLATNDVPWAKGSAWAPCIAKKNGKYYFYFCGKGNDGRSAIGVAVAKRPEGPFTAKETPVVTLALMEQYQVRMTQVIDPSVYMEGDEAYLLFGNGSAAIAKLSEDMMEILPETMQNIGGLYQFREAVSVFKRGNLYHYTWSCDDTGSENYHVNYGTSDKLYGPVQYRGTILEKDPKRHILGTGHHSITKVPGEDRYLIAYHRFATPLENYPEGKKGFYREVCLGELEFDEKGFIKKVRM